MTNQQEVLDCAIELPGVVAKACAGLPDLVKVINICQAMREFEIEVNKFFKAEYPVVITLTDAGKIEPRIVID